MHCGNIFSKFKFPQAFDETQNLKHIVEYKNGDIEARKKLIEHNIGLVIYIAKRYYDNMRYSIFEFEDIIMVGVEGLIKGIDSFDIERGVFPSFLTACINNEILMFLRRLKRHEGVVSLESVCVSDGEGNTLKLAESCLVDNVDYLEKFIITDEYKELNEAIDSLSDIDREITKMYYGFYNDECCTQKEIAKEKGISQTHVSRKIKNVSKTLRRELTRFDN